MFLYEAAPRKIHAILAKRAKFDLGSRSLKDLNNLAAQVELRWHDASTPMNWGRRRDGCYSPGLTAFLLA